MWDYAGLVCLEPTDESGVDPVQWRNFFAQENFTGKLVRRPFYREMKRKMGVKAAIEELEKALKEDVKELYHNKWLSLFQVGNYVYSHETRSNGKLVALLVVDSKKPGRSRLRWHGSRTVPARHRSPEQECRYRRASLYVGCQG